MSVVVDASALLAYLRDEPGAAVVAEAIDVWVQEGQPAVVVSAVNWIEIAQRVSDPAVLAELATVVTVTPLALDVAELAASFLPRTRALGLSLADRACLALARHRGTPVLTADRAWAEAALDVEVRLIR